jgi:hypothetical protein
MLTLLLLADVVVAQGALDVNEQLTTSPLFKEDELNVELFVPAFEPFTCHWYIGEDPPLFAVAINIAVSPAQMTESFVVIFNDGVTTGLTVIVIPVDVTAAGLAHAAFEVSMHVTTAPLVRVPVV